MSDIMLGNDRAKGEPPDKSRTRKTNSLGHGGEGKSRAAQRAKKET
jgi:hypothetical protein